MGIVRATTRNRFLTEYAQMLRSEVNGLIPIHRVIIQSSQVSTVCLERRISDYLAVDTPALGLVLTRAEPNEYLDEFTYRENSILIQRPSASMEDLQRWSNVQAWKDSALIISSLAPF
jgi:hypothetical protein